MEIKKLNKQYFQVGKEGGYSDLPQTKDDVKVTMYGLKKLGFHEKDITELRDPIFEEFHRTIMNISTQINENTKNDLNTLLFVYFAGHGQLRDGH